MAGTSTSGEKAQPATGTKRKAEVELTADDFLKDLRNKAQKTLASGDDKDLEYMVKLVRGLIAANTEIWERCSEHMVHKGDAVIPVIKMKKLCYEQAFAKTSTSYQTQSSSITTQLVPRTKDFGKAPSIPAALTDIIASYQKIGDVLPDYETYFRTGALLQDGILVSFLKSFQTHLEQVQVFLGGIEEWLSEPESTVGFLNGLFKTDLKIGSVKEEQMCTNEQATPGSSICIKCCMSRSAHVKTSYTYKWNCRNGPVGSFYKLPAAVTLLRTSSKAPVMATTFDICTEDGRDKLRAFVSFVNMYVQK